MTSAIEARAFTFTLVVKASKEVTVSEMDRHVRAQLPGFADFNVVWARTLEGDQAIVLVHTWQQYMSAIGGSLASWLGELPHNAPYPAGSLLWYR